MKYIFISESDKTFKVLFRSDDIKICHTETTDVYNIILKPNKSIPKFLYFIHDDDLDNMYFEPNKDGFSYFTYTRKYSTPTVYNYFFNDEITEFETDSDEQAKLLVELGVV